MAFSNGQNVQASDLNNFSVDTVTTSGAIVAGTTLAVGTKATVASTAADAIDVAGGITAGTGNVGIVDTTGKIPALSSTYVASLVGTSLTGIPVLLHASNGSTSTAGAENMATVAISGLTANDTLLVYYTLEAIGGIGTAGGFLYDNTDAVTLAQLTDQAGAGDQLAGTQIIGQCLLRRMQGTNTTSFAITTAYTTGNASRAQGSVQTGLAAGWTGSWTLALRKGATGGGGAYAWAWQVYKVAGQ